MLDIESNGFLTVVYIRTQTSSSKLVSRYYVFRLFSAESCKYGENRRNL